MRKSYLDAVAKMSSDYERSRALQALLSSDQIRWLKNQESVINQVDLLKSALAEWVVRHPEVWFRGTHLSDAIRLALTEFIDRHKDEFLAVD